ncbi:MAG: hypothetical protein ACYC9L_06785 [Sulfuricaulis sp.]
MSTPTVPVKVVADAAAFGMVPVSQEVFFAILGRLNVHPCAIGRYDSVTGYFSEWKTPLNEVLGGSVGGTVFSEPTYMFTPAFAAKHRARIQEIEAGLAPAGKAVSREVSA